jgi:hypothetical protein
VIEVRFTPECRRLLHLFEIAPALAVGAINQSHRNLCDDAGTRFIALGWPHSGPMTLVESRVTKSIPDLETGGQTRLFEEVTADLVIALRPEVPAGQITREMELGDQIMPLVAKSFGRRVRPHRTFPPQFWYSGPWDGTEPKTERLPREPRGKAVEILVTGSYDAASKSCDMVWAFDLERYRAWFTGG